MDADLKGTGETIGRSPLISTTKSSQRVLSSQRRALQLLWSALSSSAPKARPHTSLGQRPRSTDILITGLKARTIILAHPTASLLTLLLLSAAASAQLPFPQSAPGGPLPPTASPAPSIAPIAPPVSVFPYPAWMVALAMVALVILVGGIIWAVVRHLKNRPQPPPPTPRELALAALDRLRAKIEEMDPYPFSIEVSDVLRTFITREYRLNATRQTSQEFLAAASASARFSESAKALLAAFLEQSDLIKFAQLKASSADSAELLQQAVRFVEGGAAL